jgi:titin
LTTSSDRMADNEYTVKGLTPGKEYEFRVAAANKSGIGKFSTTDGAIEARPPDCAPKAYGFINGNKEITVKAGETLRITVPYQGSPKPTTHWSKVGEDILKENDRTKFEITQTEAALVAPNATLKDSGVYNCTLRNDFGSERVTIKVTVIDKPAQPQGPLEVTNVKADGCTLSWKPPKVRIKLNLNLILSFH